MPIYQSGLVKNRVRMYQPPVDGQVFMRESTFESAAFFADDDVIEMIPVAAGEKIVRLEVYTTEALATDGTIDVGDGDDIDRYVDGNAPGCEGGIAPWTSGLSTTTAADAIALLAGYDEDDTIDIHVDVATALAAGTAHGVVTMRAWIVGS